jgi:hypothetical protein
VLLLLNAKIFPEANVNVPVPNGPFQSSAGLFNPDPAATNVPVFVPPPINTPPLVPVVVNPPVNVFAPVNCNNPFPAFVNETALAPKYVTSVAAAIVLFALPPNVTVVPEIAVTVCPSIVDPTTNSAGTLDTVTEALPVLLVSTFTVAGTLAPVITDPIDNPATNGAYPTPFNCTGFTVIVFAPAANPKNPPVTVATFAALFELAVIGLLLLNNNVVPAGTVTVGAASPPGFVNVKLLNRFHAFESTDAATFPANVNVARPLIVTLLVAAI